MHTLAKFNTLTVYTYGTYLPYFTKKICRNKIDTKSLCTEENAKKQHL